MSATLITDLPTNFTQEILDGGALLIRCTDCSGRWAGGDDDRIVIRHTRSCGFKNQVSRPTAAQVAQAVEKADRAAKAATDVQIVAAAKAGNAATVATTDDLVDLVRCGRLSMGDAMNQDF